MRMTPRPFAVVIFGASGDLTRRKLFPALHNLHVQGLMPANTSILGTARTPYSRAEFLGEMRQAVSLHSRIAPTNVGWDSFMDDVFYVHGDFHETELFERL